MLNLLTLVARCHHKGDIAADSCVQRKGRSEFQGKEMTHVKIKQGKKTVAVWWVLIQGLWRSGTVCVTQGQ